MKSEYRTLLTKLCERLHNHTTMKSVDAFATKLVENHAENIRAAAVMYAFGKLLKRTCQYETVKFTNELLQDSFPILIEEVDRVLLGEKTVPNNIFSDLLGDYSSEQIMLIRVTCWNFIMSLLDLLEDIKLLDMEIKPNLFLTRLSQYTCLSEFVEQPDEEIYKKFTACGLNPEHCERMKHLLTLVVKEFPECLNDIFYKQKPVLHDKLCTFESRVCGTRIQLLIQNQCTYS